MKSCRQNQGLKTIILAVLLSANLFAQDLAPTVERATTLHTDTGILFRQPPLWSLDVARHTVLRSPERDIEITIVDAGKVTDGTAAVEFAWTESGGSERDVKLVLPLASRDGWDERLEVQFATSPSERQVAEALAARNGSQWIVAVLRGSSEAVDKRYAAIDSILDSLRPPGYAPEDFSARQVKPLTAGRIDKLRTFVEESMDLLGVPGVAIALVDRGEVVLEAGIGVRDLGRPKPVDAHTRFMVASNTKPLTTLLLARLVENDVFSWDTPVTDVYPQFRLGTDDATKKVRMRHLVCACTGLPRQDFGWIFGTRSDSTARNTFSQLAKTQVTSEFGEVFQYSNLLASAAGFVAGYAEHPEDEPGHAYDQAMQRWVFSPIGMTETTFSMAEALAGNHAWPHGLDVHGQPQRASLGLNYAIVPYRPAGGAWSSLRDMRRYVQTELSLGLAPSGERVVSADSILERRARGIVSGKDTWYGMGIEEIEVSGLRVLRHGGSLPGFMSDFFVFPDSDIAAVILTNSSTGALLIDPFLRRLIEVLFDARPEATSEVESAAARVRLRLDERRRTLAVPPGPEIISKLATRYSSPELGQLTVMLGENEVRLNFGQWSSAVGSRSNPDGSVSLLTIDPTVDRFEFVIGSRDGRATLRTREAQHEYLYIAFPDSTTGDR